MNINGYDKILRYLLSSEKSVVYVNKSKITNIHNLNGFRNIYKKKEVSEK